MYTFPFGYGPDWINPETGKSVKFDPFFTIIFCYETYGAQGGLGAWIHYIAVPPLINGGTNTIHKKVIKQVLNGDKLISLAISELTGGSDVANMKTAAVKSEDGKYYILNGRKYWITGGNRADYFVTIARTGGMIILIILLHLSRMHDRTLCAWNLRKQNVHSLQK